MHFLIDGYNLMKKMQLPKCHEFEEERNEFLLELKRFSMMQSQRNMITVVFDGSPRYMHYQDLSKDNISVRFSLDVEADDIIIEKVENAQNPKQLVIVTEDRRIINAVKDFGVRILKSSDFISQLAQKKLKKESRAAGSDYVTEINKQAINNEILNVWKKKYENR